MVSVSFINLSIVVVVFGTVVAVYERLKALEVEQRNLERRVTKLEPK